MSRLLAGLAVAGWGWVATAAELPSPSAIQVQSDGSLILRLEHLRARVGAASEGAELRIDLGLPGSAPVRRWPEGEGVPILHTAWLKEGIRYTQTVFVTQPDAASSSSDRREAVGEVLLVNVMGENTASDYTDATAAFAAEVAGQKCAVELRGDLIGCATDTNAPPLAVVDISSSGIGRDAGTRLEFRGHMPPGTSGSMTLKIPLGPAQGEAGLNAVRDLEFSDELRRVKKLWLQPGSVSSRPKAVPVFAGPRP